MIDADAVRAFLRDNHRGVLATTRADGRPQLSPITIGVDDDGYAVISTRQTAVKVANLRRDPWASVCVFVDEFFGDWVQLAGPVTIVELPEAMEGLVEYYRRIRGEHPDWDEYRAVMEREQRVLLRIEVREAGPNKAG